MSREAKIIATVNAKSTIKKMRNQKRIAEIAVENSKEGTDFSSSSGVDQEWFERFMDSAGFVSSETVQDMWGKILGKEFEEPGSTPTNMIRILTEITPKCAIAFQKLCSMQRTIMVLDDDNRICQARKDVVLPYNGNEDKLRKIGLSFEMLSELETLGLIKFDFANGYVALSVVSDKVISHYDGNPLVKISKSHQKGKYPIGNVMLTSAGECLKRITPVVKIENYEEMEHEYSKRQGVQFDDDALHLISINGDTVSIHNIDLKKSE